MNNTIKTVPVATQVRKDVQTVDVQPHSVFDRYEIRNSALTLDLRDNPLLRGQIAAPVTPGEPPPKTVHNLHLKSGVEVEWDDQQTRVTLPGPTANTLTLKGVAEFDPTQGLVLHGDSGKECIYNDGSIGWDSPVGEHDVWSFALNPRGHVMAACGVSSDIDFPVTAQELEHGAISLQSANRDPLAVMPYLTSDDVRDPQPHRSVTGTIRDGLKASNFMARLTGWHL